MQESATPKYDSGLRVACGVFGIFDHDDAAALTAVGKFARELNIKLTREAAEDLVFALGSALGPLRQELEKLQTYVVEGAEVRPDDVATLVGDGTCLGL